MEPCKKEHPFTAENKNTLAAPKTQKFSALLPIASVLNQRVLNRIGLYVRCATVLLAMGLIACTGSDDNGRSPTCDAISWRSASPGSVVCPGEDSCSCGGGAACCIDTNGKGKIVASGCADFSQCQDLALGCDGPEDCGQGQVCCFAGFDATCVAADECFGIGTGVACRSNTDCEVLETCEPVLEGPLANTLAVCDF